MLFIYLSIDKGLYIYIYICTYVSYTHTYTYKHTFVYLLTNNISYDYSNPLCEELTRLARD